MTLFDPQPDHLFRRDDSDTSEAAARALGGKAGTMRRRLLGVFVFAPATAEAAAARAGYEPKDGAWKRVSDLLNAGLIEDTGRRERSSSGRLQRVLAITALGRSVA